MGIRGTLVRFLALSLLLGATAHADDFGPAHDVNGVRSDARRLLAHRVRAARIDPASLAVTDVVVVNGQAMLSWNDQQEKGFMGLLRYADRWWDALDATGANVTASCISGLRTFPLRPGEAVTEFDPQSLEQDGFSESLVAAAVKHNAAIHAFNPGTSPHSLTYAGCAFDRYVLPLERDLKIHASHGVVTADRTRTGGYEITLSYAANDAGANSALARLDARAPSPAEMLAPSYSSSWGGANSVMFMYSSLKGEKPVNFSSGSMLDVWAPFVLDDRLTYDFFLNAPGAPEIGPVTGTIFDNVLHFDLPAFTLLPGKEYMGEIEGG